MRKSMEISHATFKMHALFTITWVQLAILTPSFVIIAMKHPNPFDQMIPSLMEHESF